MVTSSFVIPQAMLTLAELSVIGIEMWKRYFFVFSCVRCEMALAASMGLPPPMLIDVSMFESFATVSTAPSICETGACWLKEEWVSA